MKVHRSGFVAQGLQQRRSVFGPKPRLARQNHSEAPAVCEDGLIARFKGLADDCTVPPQDCVICVINLMPAVVHIVDMKHRTHDPYGLNEVHLASPLVAIVFPIFFV
ncbi:hypothetical protein FA10DRAFT_304937 [Acaromyces ingoldii]|uniref:Uncharacterized protein n=1 Tax=Acaromyces ingoldii TaxID=215250 RepID=A0A316YEL7_9BASI|nr:hypothetical protein FA10DRAFT_304937 [Acaromyces ingoldii]PWN86493.1 hypothetical protein FA10DRAFT_304937 [Acaromyces ingoldii]